MGYSVDTIPDTGFLEPWSRRPMNAIRVLLNNVTTPSQSFSESFPHFKHYDFPYRYGTYRCYHHAPANSSGAIFILGGRRSKARGIHQLFAAAEREKLAIIFAELPENAAGNKELMPTIEAMQDDFLERIPFYHLYKGKPCYLLGHSTGGTGVVRNLKIQDRAEDLVSKFNRIAGASTYLKAPFTNSYVLSSLYYGHVKRHFNELYGESFADRIFASLHKLKGEEFSLMPEDLVESLCPPHPENLYFSEVIEEIRQDLLSSPFPSIISETDNVILIHGNRDQFADYAKADDMARHMGVRMVTMENTFHNLYTPERISALFYYLCHGDAMPRPVPAPRPSMRSRLAESVPSPQLDFQWMLRNSHGNMGLDQTPRHGLRQRLPFLANK